MKIRKSRLAALAAAATLLLPVAGVATAQKSPDSEMARKMNVFGSIVRELQTNYVDTMKVGETFDKAIAALLMTVDPYTEYYNSDEKNDFMKMTTGEYDGIGSYVMTRDGNTYISGPFKGSPADRAGLRSGDRILRVDTTSTVKMESDKVTTLLRGKPGSRLTVEVARPWVGADSIFTFTFEREKLHTPSVPYSGIVAPGIGYINLTQFIESSPDEVRDAITGFGDPKDLKGVVLDLRSNGGGLLEGAIDILGDFLPKGTEVLRTRGRDAKSERIYKTTHKPLPGMEQMPLVVLIDGGSASTSEITAGALQDLDRAVLVGSRSFGKGLVQSTRPLPYDGLLKLTVAKYYIPSGRLIQALDYSHRNPDGSVARTPDSLTNVYKTRIGREVRDGGGLKPDVEVDWGQANRLIYNLVRDNWIFDYANRYYAQHPSLPPVGEFVITDSIFNDFKNFIDADKLKYDKVCEEMLKSLREAAQLEGYMNDSVSAEFDNLQKMLTHNLQSDLDLKRPEIEEYLGDEIVSRYYYEPGRVQQSLKTDKGLKRAIEILDDPAEYRKLLSAPAAPEKTAKK